VEITLSDASSFCIADDIWTKLSLTEGDVVNPDVLQKAASETETRRLRGVAIGMLARREHTERQLIDKLLQRNPDRNVCSSIVAELAGTGAVNDRRFADAWVRTRIGNHPESTHHLEAGLRQRGVGESLAREVVAQVLVENDLDEIGLARRVVERLTKRGRVSSQALYRRLSRLGFRRYDVERVVGNDDT
jgi:regulatory protein